MRTKTTKVCVLAAVLLLATYSLAISWGSKASASSFPGINGRLIYTDTNDYPYYQLITTNPDGSNSTAIASASSSRRYPAFSPDGTKIAFTGTVGSYQQIFIANADGSNVTQLTSGSTENIEPSFSPDGTKLIYSHANGGFYALWQMNIDGSGQTQVLSISDNIEEASYSPDGTKIIFQSTYNASGFEIYKINADGSGLTNLTNNAIQDVDPRWSPDGQKIIYASLPSSYYQIMTMNADGSSKTALTSDSNNHSNPVYSPDGTKIAYRQVVGSTPELFIMNANGSSQTRVTTGGWADAIFDWQPLTLAPTTSTPHPSISVSNGSATINIPSLYSDPYGGGINDSSVSVTTAPAYGTASVNSSTGVITYSQTVAAAHSSLWSDLASLFLPKAQAAPSTDSFSFRVCSTTSSSLCSTGTVTVNLASVTSPNTGYGWPNSNVTPAIFAATSLLALGAGVYVYRRQTKP